MTKKKKLKSTAFYSDCILNFFILLHKLVKTNLVAHKKPLIAEGVSHISQRKQENL